MDPRWTLGGRSGPLGRHPSVDPRWNLGGPSVELSEVGTAAVCAAEARGTGPDEAEVYRQGLRRGSTPSMPTSSTPRDNEKIKATFTAHFPQPKKITMSIICDGHVRGRVYLLFTHEASSIYV